MLGDRHGSLRPRRLFGEFADDERFEERAEPGAVGLGEIVGGVVDEVGGERGVDEVSDAPLLGSVGQTRAPAREQADEVQRFEYVEVRIDEGVARLKFAARVGDHDLTA